MKKYQSILSENFQFLEVKFSIYLNRCVYVMSGSRSPICTFRNSNNPNKFNWTIWQEPNIKRKDINATLLTLKFISCHSLLHGDSLKAVTNLAHSPQV